MISRTLRCVGAAIALVAATFVAAPATHAASVSFSNSACTSFSLTDLGGGAFTVTCNLPSVPVCTLQASSATPTTGSTLTLTANCTSTPYGWLWTGATCSTGSAVCTDSQTSAGSKTYTVFGGNGVGQGPVASVTVNWSAPSNPPTGCTITRTAPANGLLPTTGGSITLNASCSGGSAPTSFVWRKNGTATSVTGAAYTETLPGNSNSASVTYSYDVQGCIGSACSAASAPPTTVSVSGTAPVGFCSQYNDVRFVDLNWGSPPVDTSSTVMLVPGTIIVGRLAVPAGATSPANSPGLMSVVEFQGPTSDRIMTLSTQPCDFRGFSPGVGPTPDPTGATAAIYWAQGINPQIQFLLAGDPPTKPLLTPGTLYYVNIQTTNFYSGIGSCNTSSCDIRITVNPPH
jgi:hypothetical protein